MLKSEVHMCDYYRTRVWQLRQEIKIFRTLSVEEAKFPVSKPDSEELLVKYMSELRSLKKELAAFKTRRPPKRKLEAMNEVGEEDVVSNKASCQEVNQVKPHNIVVNSNGSRIDAADRSQPPLEDPRILRYLKRDDPHDEESSSKTKHHDVKTHGCVHISKSQSLNYPVLFEMTSGTINSRFRDQDFELVATKPAESRISSPRGVMYVVDNEVPSTSKGFKHQMAKFQPEQNYHFAERLLTGKNNAQEFPSTLRRSLRLNGKEKKHYYVENEEDDEDEEIEDSNRNNEEDYSEFSDNEDYDCETNPYESIPVESEYQDDDAEDFEMDSYLDNVDEFSNEDEDENDDIDSDEQDIDPITSKCPECNFHSKSKLRTKQHASERHSIQLTPCHECDGKMYKDIYAHYHDYHVKNECTICNKLLGSRRAFVSHISSDHGNVFGLLSNPGTARNLSKKKSKAFIRQQMDLVGMPSSETFLVKDQFAISYNEIRMHPNWTFEVFGGEVYSKTSKRKQRENVPFYVDPDLGFKQMTREGIRSTGLQLGHLAAAANHLNSEEAYRATYVMSNVVPMRKVINIGLWKSLEEHGRTITQHCDKVYVVTGPIYTDRSESMYVVGGMTLHIPSAFFKIYVVQRGKKHYVQSFVVPNKKYNPPNRFHHHVCRIEYIEKLTGLQFFSKLNVIQYVQTDYISSLLDIGNKIEYSSISNLKPANNYKLKTHNNVDDEKNLETDTVCLNCSFSSNCKRKVQLHAWEEHKVRLVPCHACQGKLYGSISIRHHHTGMHRIYKCTICADQFSTMKLFNNHLKKSHPGSFGAFVQEGPPENLNFLKGKSFIRNEIKRVGLPQSKTLLVKDEFAISYDATNMRPNWAFEVINSKSKSKDAIKGLESSDYFEDPELGFKQVTVAALNSSGFDRGHLAACGNHRGSNQSCRQSFVMSNIVPMNSVVNGGLLTSLESYIRNTLVMPGNTVYVITGPTYRESSESIYVPGGYHVSIPDSIFKVIAVQRGPDVYALCFDIPNKIPKEPFTFHHYKSTLADITTKTGFNFFTKLNLKDPSVDYSFYVCPHGGCYEIFTCTETLNDHMTKYHKKVEKIGCSECGQIFHEYLNYFMHIKEEHYNVLKVRCTPCGRQFSSLHSLVSHMFCHAQRNNNTTIDLSLLQNFNGEKKFNCSYCEKEFSHNHFLDMHVGKVHWIEAAAQPHKWTNPLNDQSENNEFRCLWIKSKNNERKFLIYKCSMCAATFRSKFGRSKHEKLVHNNPLSVQCEQCKITYRFFHVCSRRVLEVGSVSLATEPKEKVYKYSCQDCTAKYQSSAHFKNHVQTVHSGSAPEICPDCGVAWKIKHRFCEGNIVSASEKSSTDEHYNVRICKFKCPICAAKYTVNSMLTRHLEKVHTGSPPEICFLCKVAYKKRHPRCLGIPKKFPCDKCDAAFTKKNIEGRTLRNVTIALICQRLVIFAGKPIVENIIYVYTRVTSLNRSNAKIVTHHMRIKIVFVNTAN